MAEYIDRDLLKRAVHASDLENREKMALLTCISSIPAADVEPVRHGRWDGEGDGYAETEDGEMAIVYDVWSCSQCGHTIDDGTDDPDLLPKYCPNCGAMMDEEEKT